MKQELLTELVNIVNTRVPSEQDQQDLKLRFEIALEKYDITMAETHLTVWQGEENERILKKYLATKMAQGLSRRTIKYYRDTLNMFYATVGKRYDEIDADDVRLYLAKRVVQDQVSKTTANNERRNLSAFYGWLQKEEILLRNPMNKVERIKQTKKRRKAYSLLDLELIRNECRNAREKAIIEVLASTWCRVSEMVGIRIQDIEGDKTIVKGKGDKYRTVYLNPRAKLAVELYLKERKDSNPYLFPRAKDTPAGESRIAMFQGGKKKKAAWYTNPDLIDPVRPMDPSSAEAIVRNIGKRAGVDNVHPHRFRRTGATMALRQGMPLLTVCKILGHESVETTQIYLDISEEELEQAHRKFVI